MSKPRLLNTDLYTFSILLYENPSFIIVSGVYSMWFQLNNDICLNQIKYIKQIVHISHLIFTFQRSIKLALLQTFPAYSIPIGLHMPHILLFCYIMCRGRLNSSPITTKRTVDSHLKS
jgi:hypothetical protein